jgi:hypothetical protein
MSLQLLTPADPPATDRVPPFRVGDVVTWRPHPDGAERIVELELIQRGCPGWYVRTERGPELSRRTRWAPAIEFAPLADSRRAASSPRPALQLLAIGGLSAALWLLIVVGVALGAASAGWLLP